MTEAFSRYQTIVGALDASMKLEILVHSIFTSSRKVIWTLFELGLNGPMIA